MVVQAVFVGRTLLIVLLKPINCSNIFKRARGRSEQFTSKTTDCDSYVPGEKQRRSNKSDECLFLSVGFTYVLALEHCVGV